MSFIDWFRSLLSRPLVTQPQVTKISQNVSCDIPQCGLDLIKSVEGCELKAYQDQGGIWTIGYGHTPGVKQGDVCTQEQADKWLAEDCREAWDALCRLVRVRLTSNQAGALLSFIFNVGVGNFEASTLLKRLNLSDYDSIPAELRRWNKIDGKISAGLINRRNKEASLWLSDWRLS